MTQEQLDTVCIRAFNAVIEQMADAGLEPIAATAGGELMLSIIKYADTVHLFATCDGRA